MSEEKIPVTEEQFMQTIDKWIFLATGEGNKEYQCGFCDAEVKSLGGCEDCQVYHLCEIPNSAYGRWRQADNVEDKVGKEQAALEMLEGLYELGVKLGFL